MKTLKKYRKYICLGIIVVVILAVAIAATIYFVERQKIVRALDSSRYSNAKVIVWQQSAIVNDETSGFTEETDESYVPNLSDSERICTLVFDDDIVYSDGIDGEVYYYTKEGQDYVVYPDTEFGFEDDEQEVWIEEQRIDAKDGLFFDFEVLDSISVSNLKKTEDGYVCKEETFETFCDVMRVSDKEKYSNCALSFEFEGDRIRNIKASYFYNLEYYFVFEYDFEYYEQELKIPEVSKQQ